MKNFINLFILFNLLIPCCYASTSFQQTIITNVPAAVNVTAINTAAAHGTIDPATGNSSAPSASFQLQTNGTDDKYTYVMQASILTTGGTAVNAYTQISTQGYILLGNNTSSLYPTATAVNDIKSGVPVSANNANVIAYPITNTLNNLASATLTNNPAYGGLCYIITTGNANSGTIAQTLGVVPLSNTYSINNDRAGIYQAVVTFTANRNP